VYENGKLIGLKCKEVQENGWCKRKRIQN
jgi:hypothetical protein